MHPNEVEITPSGVPEDRRFYLVDERAKLLNGTRDGPLFGVRAECDPAAHGSRCTSRTGAWSTEPSSSASPR